MFPFRKKKPPQVPWWAVEAVPRGYLEREARAQAAYDGLCKAMGVPSLPNGRDAALHEVLSFLTRKHGIARAEARLHGENLSQREGSATDAVARVFVAARACGLLSAEDTIESLLFD